MFYSNNYLNNKKNNYLIIFNSVIVLAWLVMQKINYFIILYNLNYKKVMDPYQVNVHLVLDS